MDNVVHWCEVYRQRVRAAEQCKRHRNSCKCKRLSETERNAIYEQVCIEAEENQDDAFDRVG